MSDFLLGTFIFSLYKIILLKLMLVFPPLVYFTTIHLFLSLFYSDKI